ALVGREPGRQVTAIGLEVAHPVGEDRHGPDVIALARIRDGRQAEPAGGRHSPPTSAKRKDKVRERSAQEMSRAVGVVRVVETLVDVDLLLRKQLVPGRALDLNGLVTAGGIELDALVDLSDTDAITGLLAAGRGT